MSSIHRPRPYNSGEPAVAEWHWIIRHTLNNIVTYNPNKKICMHACMHSYRLSYPVCIVFVISRTPKILGGVLGSLAILTLVTLVIILVLKVKGSRYPAKPRDEPPVERAL